MPQLAARSKGGGLNGSLKLLLQIYFDHVLCGARLHYFSSRQEREPAYHETSMKQDAAFFEGKQPVLIYIAKKLKEALRLEATLTEAGIDYGVEADEYRGGVIFRSARVGAFFYVLPETVAVAHETMLR